MCRSCESFLASLSQRVSHWSPNIFIYILGLIETDFFFIRPSIQVWVDTNMCEHVWRMKWTQLEPWPLIREFSNKYTIAYYLRWVPDVRQQGWRSFNSFNGLHFLYLPWAKSVNVLHRLICPLYLLTPLPSLMTPGPWQANERFYEDVRGFTMFFQYTKQQSRKPL